MSKIFVVFAYIIFIHILHNADSCSIFDVFSLNRRPETCPTPVWLDIFKLDCPSKYFHLPWLPNCHQWLNCSHLNDIRLRELIGVGAVKAVYRAEWRNISIAYSVLNNAKYHNDFYHGLTMLKTLNPSPFIVQLIGYCEKENVILTEYHSFGNATLITEIIQVALNGIDNFLTRLKLCLNYANILNFLHNSPVGIRVFCDSDNLDKLLSQMLITNECTLVLNDCDALPEVSKENNFSVKCGHFPHLSPFNAPEQIWFSNRPYNDTEMQGYNEKTDIWKSASVCEHFLSESVKTDVIARYHLFALHESCRSKIPEMRPTAFQLTREYSEIIEMYVD